MGKIIALALTSFNLKVQERVKVGQLQVFDDVLLQAVEDRGSGHFTIFNPFEALVTTHILLLFRLRNVLHLVLTEPCVAVKVSTEVKRCLDIEEDREITKNTLTGEYKEGIVISCLPLLNFSVYSYNSIPNEVDLLELLARLDDCFSVGQNLSKEIDY